MKDVVRISRFDGQRITAPDGRTLYEVGSYLGGGISGIVYEVEHLESSEHLALKVLNPIGYKLESKAALKQCKVVAQGKPLQGGDGGLRKSLGAENVWWLFHGPSGRVVAAFHDVERGNLIREMTLPMCVEVWGLNFQIEDADETWDSEGHGMEPTSINALLRRPPNMVQGPQGQPVAIPAIPPKFESFLRSRAKVYREISHMRKLSHHHNVLRLEEVLEMTEDSKMTIFLVLELAKGGELFDRIAVDKGATESTARTFFQQLLAGVLHCHEQGVCHRDLKPENLLLADEEGSTLKIGDFGLSALSRSDDPDETVPGLSLAPMPTTPPTLSSSLPTRMVSTPPSPLRAVSMRKLKSVVGSPFYVAPEILNNGPNGYDGTKADMWSVGVILYAMLHGNLPFDKDLHSCLRFHNFCLWLTKQRETLSRRVADGKDDGMAARLRKRFDADAPALGSEPEAKRVMTFSNLTGMEPGVASLGTAASTAPLPLSGASGMGLLPPGSLSSSSSPVQPGWDSFATPLPGYLASTPPRLVDVAAVDVASAPTWLFPEHFSLSARSLLCALLTPDPEERLSVHEALQHPWVLEGVQQAVPGEAMAVTTAPAAAAMPTAASLDHAGMPYYAETMDAEDVVSNNLALASGAFASTADLVAEGDEDRSEDLSQECMFEDSMEEPDFPPSRDASEQSFRSDDEASTVAMDPFTAQSPPIAIPRAMAEAYAGRSGIMESGSIMSGDASPAASGGGGTFGSLFGSASQSSEPDSKDRRTNIMPSPPLVDARATPSAFHTVPEFTLTGLPPGTAPPPQLQPSQGGRASPASQQRPFPATSPSSLSVLLMGQAVGGDGPNVPDEELSSDPPRAAHHETRSSLVVHHSGPVSGPTSSPGSPGSLQLHVDAFPPPSGFSMDALPPYGSPLPAYPPFGSPLPSRNLDPGFGGHLFQAPNVPTLDGMDAAAAAPHAAHPPQFQDLVKRSTRFVTSVPAAEVLRGIEEILNNDTNPLPPPFRNVPQRTVLHLDDYRLDVKWGGVLVYSVQVFLIRGDQGRSQYMVEFRRGHLMDIFQFKRYFEDVRDKLQRYIKEDRSVSYLNASGIIPHRFGDNTWM